MVSSDGVLEKSGKLFIIFHKLFSTFFLFIIKVLKVLDINMERKKIIELINAYKKELYGLDGNVEIAIEEVNTIDNMLREILKPKHIPSSPTFHMTDQQREKISQSCTGQRKSEATKERMRQNSRHFNVWQYDFEGNLVGIWESTQEAGRHGYNNSIISKCCRGIKKSAYGCKWSYKPLHEQERDIKVIVKQVVGDTEITIKKG